MRFAGKDIAEVQAGFAGNNDPALFPLTERIWDHCGSLYAAWDKYEGWDGMLKSAAENGQPSAMIMTVVSHLTNQKIEPAAIPVIESALTTGDVGQ